MALLQKNNWLFAAYLCYGAMFGQSSEQHFTKRWYQETSSLIAPSHYVAAKQKSPAMLLGTRKDSLNNFGLRIDEYIDYQ